jgi:hypothetical protein
MAILAVGGSNRGVGKTALVCGLIAALPEYPWVAVKFTSHDHGLPEPIWEEPARSPDAQLAQGQKTDTARYLAAGARRALLCTSTPGSKDSEPDLSALLSRLWLMFGRGTNFIFESNSIVHHVSPDVFLLVNDVWQGLSTKPSFTAALGFADAMVTHAKADGITPDGLRLAGQPAKPIFHLARLERVSPEMLAWLRRKLPPVPHS